MRSPRKIKLWDRASLIRLAILSIILIIVTFGVYLTVSNPPLKGMGL